MGKNWKVGKRKERKRRWESKIINKKKREGKGKKQGKDRVGREGRGKIVEGEARMKRDYVVASNNWIKIKKMN